MKKEILNRVKKAKYCYVWCVLDSYDVGYYFRTSKTEVLFYIRKYLKNNKYGNLEKLLSKAHEIKQNKRRERDF